MVQETGLSRRSGSRRRAGRTRREADVPAAEQVLAALEREGAPATLERLAEQVEVAAEPQALAALEAQLAGLIRAGEVLRNRRDEYLLVRKADLVPGRVQGHRDGFGFLIPDHGDQDIFLPARQMRRLFDGDRAAVQVRGQDRQGRPMGSVMEVLERAHSELVGRLHRESGVTYVVPDNPRIPHHVVIPRGGHGGAQAGEAVLVGIEEYPEEHRLAIGRVSRVLGSPGAPGMEVEMAVHAFALPHEWPEEALAEAEAMPQRVPTAAKQGRVDLRELPLVTIDGADARDFDDAVYCEPADDGWRILVAIADVSHYVRPGSPLDQEAQRRGTSVYFPNRVIPMLPEALSNGLCSLNPQVDRLCMVCDMHLGRDGKVTGSEFYSAVMRSAARLTYDDVTTLLETGRGRPALQRLAGPLRELHAAWEALIAARRRRGALDFDVPEVAFDFDEHGHVTGLSPRHRGVAHRIIEECMIAANVEAARFLRHHRMPTLYRVHEGPADEKLEELRLFLATFEVKLPKGQTLKPRDLYRAVERLHDHPERELVEMVVLRSMQAAVYRPRNIGHFGLALPGYAHFTSPIRRYPDLLVHRGIRQVLEHGSAKGFAYAMPDMERLGDLTSRAERRADEATWDAHDRLKCEFMQDHIGTEYDGVITGVMPFGVFVRLSEVHVEGLVHVSYLGKEYFRHDPVRRALVGERSGTVFGLTGHVRVRVLRVNLEDRKIDFELVEVAESVDTPEPAPARKGRRRRRR
ncbi:MAG: ribonuclease R [Gammaproteobacteria bacterium]|nr:MAG: ribonuclease R [Gammaproteobacteria bacterium]